MKAVITNRASLIVDTEKGACDAADDLFSLRLAAVMVPVVSITNDQAFDIFQYVQRESTSVCPPNPPFLRFYVHTHFFPAIPHHSNAALIK